MLPPSVHGFAGRDSELSWLDALAQRAARDRTPAATPDTPGVRRAGAGAAAICGPAGIGKTALALHWAHRVVGTFPGGQLYAELGGAHPDRPLAPTLVLRGFLRALGVPPDRIPQRFADQAELYQAVLAGRRVLVVLDDVAAPETIRPLLPAGPGSLAVLTVRPHPAAPAGPGGVPRLGGATRLGDVATLVLGPLADPDAHRLLAELLGADRLAADPRSVTDILRAARGIPRMLSLVAARAALAPPVSLAELAALLRGLPAYRPDGAVTDPEPAGQPGPGGPARHRPETGRGMAVTLAESLMRLELLPDLRTAQPHVIDRRPAS
jgi:hypothetical protein